MRQDLLYALRTLRKNRGYTFVVILTLALGIGTTTTMFTVFYGVVLRSLPYESSERLVMIWNRYAKSKHPKAHVSPPDYLDRKRESRTLSHMAAIEQTSVNFIGKGGPQRLRIARVSASLFATLGVPPIIGRDFLSEEDQPGKNSVVIISNNLWRNRFGSDTAIIGRVLNLSGAPHNVIGVMPKGFWFPDPETDLWMPIAFTEEQKADKFRGNEYMEMVARIRPGVRLEQVQAEMNAIAAGVLVRVPERREFLTNAGWGAIAMPLRDAILGDVETALYTLMGAVLFLLLIGCANVANLILARTGNRGKEIAIRSALGAGRFSIVRLLFLEALLLAVVGGFLGIAVAYAGTALLPAIAPESLPRVQDISIDETILLFTLLASLFTAISIAIIPVCRVSMFRPAESLKLEGGGTAPRSVHRFRNLLVIAEMALALVLATGAALLIKSFQNLNSVDPGFQTTNRLVFTLSLPATQYSESAQIVQFYQRFQQELKSLPGVREAGANASLPIAGLNWTATFAVEEKPLQPGEPQPGFEYRMVTPNYFRAMGIPLLMGRDFNHLDTDHATEVAIIDERLAERYWKNGNPIGKRVGFSNSYGVRWREVIGVVKHVRNDGPQEEGAEQIYFPLSQMPEATMTFVVHTEHNPASLVPSIRDRVSALDANLPIYQISTLEKVLATSIAQPKFNMLLFVLFAATALALAGVGIYGVMSYSVMQRRREIGIRMAIGARPGNVLQMIVRQSLFVSSIGLVCGIFGSLLLSRFLGSLLFGLQPFEPALYGTAVIVALLIAVAAATIPARRAAMIDPLRTLRED